MNPESMLRAFILCDSDPDDRLAWETFLRDLQRSGHNGPLTDFVERYLRRKVWPEVIQARIDTAVKAWEPLVSQGFALFTRGVANYQPVFHIGRLNIKGQWCTEYYPEGWQYGELRGLCHSTPGVVFAIPGYPWTQRKVPFRGDEYIPCKACLQRIHHLPWQDTIPLTSEQVTRLWKLRNDE